MNAYFFNNLPLYCTANLIAVRDPLDNFSNILALVEAINLSPQCLLGEDEDEFELAVFTKDFQRFLFRIGTSLVSMSNPFQVVVGSNNSISFNCDMMQEPVDGKFISIMRNAIQTAKNGGYSHDDIAYSLGHNFPINFKQASFYTDTFFALIANDHGYIRFDDDPYNANGDIHPRYHYDIFFKNTSSIKVGYRISAQLECFLALFDKTKAKKYLT